MKSFQHILHVVKLLSKNDRRKLLVVVFMAIFMALIEVIGVGSIMPFMTVASNPAVIHTHKILIMVYSFLHFSSDRAFIIFLGVVVLAFLVITNVTQAFMSYIKVKFTSMRRHSLSLRMLEGYLSQDYVFFLNRNSHEFVKNINTEIQQMINGTLMQLVDLISRVIQTLVLTGFLFFINPLSTLGITVVMIGIYGTIYFFVRNVLKRLGLNRFNLNSERTKTVSEAFWGIKEVKITGTEQVYVDEFSGPSKELAKNESISEIIGDVPKFALETAAFSSIMFFVMFTIIKSGTFVEVAGTVTLYAYAGYRMIPAVQGLFKAITKLKYSAPTAELLIKEFDLISGTRSIQRNSVKTMPFEHSLKLTNICFTYPNMAKPVLGDISLTIKSNELLGFAGTTGSGKTTLIDIVLGLLVPQSGQLLVDDVLVTSDKIRSWQKNLGYVPQNIYLSNTSISRNIAFGIPYAEIDMEAVKKAASMAQIDDFISKELPQGYETEIGERGIRLSGGQRQRIGIARALYRNPSILIMDEATSALDSHTEKAVMEAIDSLQGTRTIILIAHRLTTLQKCDTVYLMEKGAIVDSGTYAELEQRSSYFNNMITDNKKKNR